MRFRRFRCISACTPALLLTFLVGGSVEAADFAIELKVQVGKKSISASEEKAELGAKAKKREIMKVQAGDRVDVRWAMTNRDKAIAKNVLVHFFSVKLTEPGQKTQPKLDKGVQAETALVMDFNPKDQTKGELNFTLPAAGAYLLRLETIGAAGDGGSEFFAALELLAEER